MVPVQRIHLSLTSNPIRADPAKTRYGGAVDIERAADLHVQGWTLRQVANELALTE